MGDSLFAPCRRDYYPAVHSSGKRSIDDIYWIVLHDEEALTARSAAGWFRNPDSSASTHLCLDDSVCYRTLPNDAIPWGSASAIGANTHGFHIEQAGYARWSAAVWLSHRRTLRRAAYKTALHCHVFVIPPLWRGARDLIDGHRAGKPRPGITSHRAVSAASRVLDPSHAYRYTHYDPGAFWPRRLFMSYVLDYWRAFA